MGGEVLRKKKSERGRMWEVGKGRRGDGGGEDRWKKVVGCCVLAVAREEKRATAKSLATAPFHHTRYC